MTTSGASGIRNTIAVTGRMIAEIRIVDPGVDLTEVRIAGLIVDRIVDRIVDPAPTAGVDKN
jgi:hypothetical protein